MKSTQPKTILRLAA